MFPSREAAEKWLNDYHYDTDEDGWVMCGSAVSPSDHSVEWFIDVSKQIDTEP
jgi:glycine cleavage system aminomethyltransferase T